MVTQQDVDLTNLLNRMALIGVKVVRKSDSQFWSWLNRLVILVTFGKNKGFLDHYVTTIGNTIAVPTNWDSLPSENKVSTLSHELIHVSQYHHYSVPLVALMYCLLPLPIGLAYCRYRFERVAYAVGIKVMLRYRPDLKAWLIDQAVEQLTGSSYGWTWPFKKSVRNWFEKNI